MITLQQAKTANEFWHMTARAKVKGNDRQIPRKVRRNGATQTWKKWPHLFRIPVKYGLKEYFYIQNFTDEHDGNPAPATKRGIQPRNDHLWCTPENWPAEHQLFQGVTS